MKIKETVSRKTFLGFIIAILIFMITSADILLQEAKFEVLGIPSNIFYYILKVAGYTLVTGLVVFAGVKNSGINRFVAELVEALRDGKLTPEEKLTLITIAKDEFLGQWADLSNQVYQKQEKNEAPPLE